VAWDTPFDAERFIRTHLRADLRAEVVSVSIISEIRGRASSFLGRGGTVGFSIVADLGEFLGSTAEASLASGAWSGRSLVGQERCGPCPTLDLSPGWGSGSPAGRSRLLPLLPAASAACIEDRTPRLPVRRSELSTARGQFSPGGRGRQFSELTQPERSTAGPQSA